MKSGIIYVATNIKNGKKYVGQTYTSLLYRKAKHISSAFKFNSQLTFHQALRKHGVESFVWNTVENVSASSLDDLNLLLDEKEIYWDIPS